MPLLRDLTSADQLRVKTELNRRQDLLRRLYRDFGRRAMTMLLVLLVGGVATTLTVTIKTTGPTGVPIAALVCFLVGLVFIGISQVITNEFLWRFTFRLSAYRSGILQSEIDTETLSASVKPTGTLRIPTYFGYAAFIIWSIGAALTVLALANHTVTAASTGLERPAASPPLTVAPSTQAPESITSAPPTNTKGIAPLPTATSEAIQLADKIAIAAVLVGLIQAVALIVTFGVTRSTARRQLRAYVFAEAFDLIDGAIATPIQHARAGVPGAVLSIKNQGATPLRRSAEPAR